MKSKVSNKPAIKDQMRDAMVEFWEQVIFPHFDNRFNETNEKLSSVANEVTEIKEDVNDLIIKSDQNRREHDRMFERLDQQDKDAKRILSTVRSIEATNIKHGLRIKLLEKTLQAD